MTPKDLDGLVERIQQGDREAFTDLVHACQRELWLFLSAHASSVHMIEEVMQKVYVTSYLNIKKYEPRGTFLSWMKGIARNLVLKDLKERNRMLAMEPDALETTLTESGLTTLEASDDLMDERIGNLQRCLKKLSEESRALLKMRYTQQLSVKILAQELGRQVSWVTGRLCRLRKSLRICMTK